MERIKYIGIYLPRETKDLYIESKVSDMTEQLNWTDETIKHFWKKTKMTQIDGEIYHVRGLEESV